jgi:hypothetical protein
LTGNTSRTRKRPSVRRRLASLAAVALGALALGAQPASALVYTSERGPYDMRGYISTPGSMFGCSTGHLYLGGYTVRAPTFGARVYMTFTIFRWNGSQWVGYNPPGFPAGSTLYPGGRWVQPGYTSYPFQAARIDLPTPPGYYAASISVDYKYGSGSEMGAVDISPNYASDWSSSYSYAGPVSGQITSFCYHY